MPQVLLLTETRLLTYMKNLHVFYAVCGVNVS